MFGIHEGYMSSMADSHTQLPKADHLPAWAVNNITSQFE
jgi:hypothetical protein